MGAPRVTPKEVIQMQRLYAELGNFAAVGRAMNPKRSGSTVAKYIKMDNVLASIRIAIQNLSAKEGKNCYV